MKNKKIKFFCIFFIFCLSFNVFSQENYTAIDYYNLGRQAELTGDFFKAVEMYKSSLMLNQSYLNAITGLAHAYYQLNEFDESLKYVKHAENFDTKNTDMLILKARIYLNTGKFEESKKIFKAVLDIEENNIDAEFGLAELDIASGRTYAAANRYKNVLMFSPKSRKALLSLVILNDSNGNFKDADIYIQQALKIYSENHLVRFTAAKHYYYMRNIVESEYHLKTALIIKPDFLDAGVFLAEIYMDQSKYQKAAEILEESLKSNESEFILWYMLGRCYEKLNQPKSAEQFYARAILNKPDEEVARIAIENLLSSKFSMDSKERISYSDYHITMGEKYEGMNLRQKALKEYRRAIKINPYSWDARYKYALINKAMGYNERYIQILEQIRAEGYDSLKISDEIEIEKSLLEKTISEKWGVDQFQIEKEKNKISLFISNCNMIHIEGEEILNEYLKYLILRFENIEILNNSVSEKFADCFRIARENNSDKFFIINCHENERIVSLSAEIYNASTGGLIKTLSVTRTGNQMFINACQSLIDQIIAILPTYGRILSRNFDNVLVNLGKKDGINIDDEMYILKKGSLKFSKNDFNFKYEKDEILGTYKVKKTDELISEGVVTPAGFFDMINQGDVVFLKPEEKESEEKAETDTEQLFILGDMLKSILNIR